MPRQTKKPNLFQLMLAFILPACFCDMANASEWQTLAPGIEYRDLSPNPMMPWAHIHAFRIDLKKQSLDLVTAKDLARPHASVQEMAQHSHALLAINGGFFDTQHNPLGLRVSHKQRISPLKPISWWGIFYVARNKPYLTKASLYQSKSHGVDFAIQSGPRLLINGRIPKLKPAVAERTALGITKNNRVILLVTEHAAMTTTALAKRMKSFPLYCEDALNLDGGSSTQIYANIGSLHLNTPGALGVSDAVIIKAKT